MSRVLGDMYKREIYIYIYILIMHVYICLYVYVYVYEEGAMWGFNRVTIENSKLRHEDFRRLNYLINSPTLTDP